MEYKWKHIGHGIIVDKDDKQIISVWRYEDEIGNIVAAAPRMAEWLKELPLNCGCVYLDEDNPTIPTFTIDTEYLQLAKDILAEVEGVSSINDKR